MATLARSGRHMACGFMAPSEKAKGGTNSEKKVSSIEGSSLPPSSFLISLNLPYSDYQ